MDDQATNAIPDAEPFELFAEWFTQARKSELNDPEAVAVATATPDGAPSVRMVLMKDFSPEGFVFYTNGHSRKGGELAANPQAAMLFHWKSLRRQVRIEGLVSEVDPAEADAYFASRPRGSQLGAWASRQSETLDARDTFEARLAKFEAEFADREVPRPPRWSGFRVIPRAVEFWYGAQYRLHERWLHERGADGAWSKRMLYP